MGPQSQTLARWSFRWDSDGDAGRVTGLAKSRVRPRILGSFGPTLRSKFSGNIDHKTNQEENSQCNKTPLEVERPCVGPHFLGLRVETFHPLKVLQLGWLLLVVLSRVPRFAQEKLGPRNTNHWKLHWFNRKEVARLEDVDPAELFVEKVQFGWRN